VGKSHHLAPLAVLCAASFLAVIDTTIVSIALPTIRRAFAFSAGGAQWVLNAYVLVFGGLLLLFGRLADRIGRRRAFMCGLVLFGLGSVVSGVATHGWLLILGRFVQGIGAAAFVPSSLSLLTSMFSTQRERSRALAAYGAMAGLGFVAGMVGGGVVTELWGWRWIFLVNVPVVCLTLGVARRLLHEHRGDAAGTPVDAAGALAVTGGLVLLIFALTSGPRAGWLAPSTMAAGVLGVVMLAVFIGLEHRHPAPLVPTTVVARVDVLASNTAIALESMVGVAWLFLLTLYLQDVRGQDALVSGLLFAPMTAASIAGAVTAGRAAVALGTGRTVVIGLLLVTVGLAAMALAMSQSYGLATVLIGMIVGEFGFMLASVGLTVVATSSLEDKHAGLAAGLLNTSTQLGGGVGLGIVAAVVAATAPHGDITAHSLQLGFLSCGLFSLLALALVIAALRRPAKQTSPRGESDQALSAIHQGG
jgi:EmrB/QacA subfamily drug resistance transporter